MKNILGIRIFKILLLLSTAITLLLAFIGNIIAYDTNFEYTHHIMLMDDTFKDPHLMARAIQNPLYHHIAYIFIIILEGIASLFLWMGVLCAFKNIYQPTLRFEDAKYWGNMGLLFSLWIYSFVFFTVAGQWFASWQSEQWNAKTASVPFLIILGITYLIFSQPEKDA